MTNGRVLMRFRLAGLLALSVVGAVACGREPASTSGSASKVELARGKRLLEVYGCGGCHVIPGVRRAVGTVGPPLTAFARRGYIAGEMANTPANLIRWISVPQAIEPGTAMPNLGVTEDQATDMASYLYTLR